MHIVSLPSMLTLTVDRLVGNSGGSGGVGHVHGRVAMSPASSDAGSDTSSVSPNKSSPPPLPSHFTSHKISLLLGNSKHGPGSSLSPATCPADMDEESANSGVSTSLLVKVEEDQREVEGESHHHRESKGEDAVVSRLDFVTCVMKGEDTADGVMQRRDKVLDPGTSANHPRLVGGEGGEGDDGIGLCDDERPPSSAASGGSTGSTWSNTTATTTILSQPNPNQTHNSPKLKFSIHDILRPDFGQRAITKTHTRPSLRDRRGAGGENGNGHHFDRENHNRETNNNGMGRNERKRSRPSSIRNHSEDSNSSCSSSRRGEVVDESKVNPEVPKGPLLWPAWVYCTRYSDRPSSGPRSRRVRKKSESSSPRSQEPVDEKRPRTAFTAEQLGKLKHEFDENRYLTEKRRQDLARDLKLHENQIKIWFQNKRAKLKKSNGQRGCLAEQLMAQGLYNHSTVPMDEDEDYLPC